MRYDPRDATICWPKGDYEATIVAVDAGKSKSSGAEMETLTFKVYHPDGREQTVRDYIVNPATLFKLKKLAKALGHGEKFEAGTFQAYDCIGANVLLSLDIDEQEGFDDKNKIVGYKPSGVKPKAAYTPLAAATKPMSEDDIPF